MDRFSATGLPLHVICILLYMPRTKEKIRNAISSLEDDGPSTFGQRLKLARTSKGWSQDRLATEVRKWFAANVQQDQGIAQNTVAQLERTGAGSAFTPVFAELLGVRPLWLATGEGEMQENALATIQLGKVPLVSSVAAGLMSEAADLLPAGFADEWVTCSVPVKAHTFALRVDGDSMEPRFPEGMILVVEPELEARPGDFVIAKNEDNEATFKQLVRESGDYYLKPLNPRYPIKPLGNAQIVGVVRQVLENFR